MALAERLAAARTIEATEALLTVGDAILQHYREAKNRLGALDYDDLIVRTGNLLARSEAAQWVLYKLDAGLDHILVDEAQDTSPAQWAIVAALAGDFFAGETAAPRPRTIFAVGDDKQSIFSFQGAVPRIVADMAGYFGRLAEGAGGRFETVPLGLSFRSTQEVLSAVDRVFADPELEGVLVTTPNDTHKAMIDEALEAGKAVYTDKPLARSYRGYGIPPGARASEQELDEIAKRLRMDPVDLRMKNIFVDGDVSYWGERLHSVGLKETLIKATHAIGWGKKPAASKPTVKIGKGFACIQKPTRSPTTSSAGVLINSRGEVTVLAGTVEIGQGCNTILSQVAAEELKVAMDKVRMHPLDTDIIPFDASTTSSRSTYHMGNAVRRAAIHAREQIAEAASPMLEAKKDDLDFADGKVFLKDHPEMAFPIGEVIRRKLGTDGTIRGDGSYTYEIAKDLDLETGHSDHASAFYMYATQAAEVAVDEESGRVRLLRMAAAHDVGKAINPLNCVAQIEGGLAMGIGSALHEEMVIDSTGKVRNPSFLDYHLVTSLDVPEMIPIIVECPEPKGPYGAKGLGEPGLAPTPAAIGNAVADALGVRIYDLPLTPERVYWAIQRKKKAAA